MGFEGSPNAHLGKTSSPHRFAPIKLPQDAEPLATLEPSSQGQKQLSAEPLNPSQVGNESSVDPRSKIKGMTHTSSANTKVPGVLPNEAETLREDDGSLVVNRYALVYPFLFWSNLMAWERSWRSCINLPIFHVSWCTFKTKCICSLPVLK